MDHALHLSPWEELYRYWLDRHADGKPPTRAEIDPMIDLRHLASNLMLIDVLAGHAEYRLIGSQLTRHFGIDYTGRTVGNSAANDPEVAAWRHAVEDAAAQGKPVLLASYYPGAGKTRAVALLMPLTPDADGERKLFGAIFFAQPFPDVSAVPDLPLKLIELGV